MTNSAAAPAARWTRSATHFDPSVIVREFTVDGRLFVATAMFHGSAMSVRPATNPHLTNSMAGWEDWDAAADAARACLATETRRAAPAAATT